MKKNVHDYCSIIMKQNEKSHRHTKKKKKSFL